MNTHTEIFNHWPLLWMVTSLHYFLLLQTSRFFFSLVWLSSSDFLPGHLGCSFPSSTFSFFAKNSTKAYCTCFLTHTKSNTPFPHTHTSLLVVVMIINWSAEKYYSTKPRNFALSSIFRRAVNLTGRRKCVPVQCPGLGLFLFLFLCCPASGHSYLFIPFFFLFPLFPPLLFLLSPQCTSATCRRCISCRICCRCCCCCHSFTTESQICAAAAAAAAILTVTFENSGNCAKSRQACDFWQYI